MQETFQLAGITFRHKEDKEVANLRPAGLVNLEPEPDNKFDPDAIRVIWGGHHIGYVPSKKSKSPNAQAAVRQAMASGKPWQCEIKEYRYRDGEDWNDEHRGKLGCVTLCLCTEGDENVIAEGGKLYGRISDFCQWFYPGGYPDALKRWEVNHANYEALRKHMDELAARGTKMHDALEQFFCAAPAVQEKILVAFGARKTARIEGVDAPWMGDLPDGLPELLNKFTIKMISTENRLFDDDTQLSGRYDMEAQVFDKRSNTDLGFIIIDWKSSSAVREHHKLQAGWYAGVKSRQGEDGYGAMVVAFGRGLSFALLGTQQTGYAYEIVKLLRRAEKGYKML